MAFSRTTGPAGRPPESVLTSWMVGIGMNFAADATPDANIEDTLLFASEVGMLEGDLRVLGILVQWLEAHQEHINADRLVRVVRGHTKARLRAFWAAVGAWLGKDRRFARLEKLHQGGAVQLLPVGNDFQISRRGEDPRFAGTSLLVPAGTLRQRTADVLSPAALARTHAGYRNRVLMGPTWRADVWTALEANPDLSAAAAARRAYCAFATAWQVKRDFDLFHTAS